MADYKITQRVGALHRREYRRLLERSGVSFTEDKGLLDSQFTITCYSIRTYRVMLAWCREVAVKNG